MSHHHPVAPSGRRRVGPFRGVIALLVFFVLLLCPIEALSAKRKALVIANSEYTHTVRLPNPPNDADLISEKLTSLGFDVIPYRNVSAKRFTDILNEFAATLDKDTAAVFYYAGHGVQYENENFLVGVDASEEAIRSDTFSLDGIIESIEKQAGTTFIFWDACRDNPLARRLPHTPAGSVPSSSSGAAAIAPREGNTLVMFSARPGKVATDGAGNNSPFAEALARRITTPDLDADTMVKMVAADVKERTHNDQEPQPQSKLNALFYFKAQGSKSLHYEAQIKALEQQLAAVERGPRPKIRYNIMGVSDSDIAPGPTLSNAKQSKVTRSTSSVKFSVNAPIATIIRKARVSPDGKILAIGGDDGFIRLINLNSFVVIRSIKVHVGRVSDIDFAPDGRSLLSVGRDGSAHLLRLEGEVGDRELFKIPEAHLYSGRINPDYSGRFVLTGDSKGRLYAKDIKRNKVLTDAKFHSGPVHAVAYQPHGKGTYFSAGADGLLKIRRPDGQRITLKAHDGVIFQVGYDPSGRLAYTAGYDRKIKIWDAKAGFSRTPLRVLEGHSKYVLAVAVSRDGQTLVSAGGDKALNVWSLASGNLVAHLLGHTDDVESVTLTADNQFIISTSEDKSMRIWSAQTGQELVRMFFRKESSDFAGLTFDNHLFGDEFSGLIVARAGGKEISDLEYIGRGISISANRTDF